MHWAVTMDKHDNITEATNQILNDKYSKPLEGPVHLNHVNAIDEVISILYQLLLNRWLP